MRYRKLRGPRAAEKAVLAVLAAVLLLSPATGSAKLEEGEKAVDFKGKDFLTNEKLDLEAHLGKRVILLDFGSIYCSSCMVTVPNLIKLRKNYEKDDLAIFNIYLDIYAPQRVVKFFRGFAKDIDLSLLIDDKLAISREYGIDTLPTTVIIDRSGTIRRRIVGYTEADEKEIDEIIESLVHEKPLLGPSAAAAGALTIHAPDSFTKTTQDKVYIVGTISGEGTKDVSMKLNNLPEVVELSKDNIFHFRTPLSLAMNLIEVKGQVGEDKSKSQSVVLFRETPMRADIRSELPPYRFHRDEENKNCKNCHEMNVSIQDKSALQQSKMCNNCHTDMAQELYTHGPITVGGCLPCHDYQSSPNKYEVRTMGPALCYGCHEKIKETIEGREFLHGPTAAGMCIVCHDPHGSVQKFLMRKKTDRMCVSCHQDFLREFSMNTIHLPVEEGNCTGCHDPHASDDSKMLVVPKDELCDKCHTMNFSSHMHRTGALPTVGDFTEGTPTNPDGGTVCYSCHLFHASDLPSLWRGADEQECGTGCHEEEEEEE